jgi:hypothetical protein
MRALALSILAALLASPAIAADLDRGAPAAYGLEGTPSIPACDDASVLNNIVKRQHWAEANTWQNGVLIDGITDIRQLYNTTKFASEIERRHCLARASLGSTEYDRLYYTISEKQGFAGLSWYVDFCMPRHDYYRVYDGDCRVLK